MGLGEGFHTTGRSAGGTSTGRWTEQGLGAIPQLLFTAWYAVPCRCTIQLLAAWHTGQRDRLAVCLARRERVPPPSAAAYLRGRARVPPVPRHEVRPAREHLADGGAAAGGPATITITTPAAAPSAAASGTRPGLLVKRNDHDLQAGGRPAHVGGPGGQRVRLRGAAVGPMGGAGRGGALAAVGWLRGVAEVAEGDGRARLRHAVRRQQLGAGESAAHGFLQKHVTVNKASICFQACSSPQSVRHRAC